MFILYFHEILLASNAWSMGDEMTLRTNTLSLKCISTTRAKFDRMPDDLYSILFNNHFEAGIELIFLYNIQ